MSEPIEISLYGYYIDYQSLDGYLESDGADTYSYVRSGSGIITKNDYSAYMDVGQYHTYGSPFPPMPEHNFYGIWRGFLFFNTSIIPANASIISAVLKLYSESNNSELPDINFNLTIQKFSHYPFSEDDWPEENYEGNGGSLNTSLWVLDAYNEIEFNNDGLNMIIKSGITCISLRSDKDINSIPPNTNTNEMLFICTQDNDEELHRPVLVLTYIVPEIINIKAEPDSTQTAIRLYGEILSGENIIEKGFEYLIQDEEPTEEAIGIEVIKEKPTWMEFWEIGEYWAYEYEGNNVDFWDRLYHLSEDEYKYEHHTIWWFRAYCKIGEDKYIAETWIKNISTVTTFECTEVSAQRAIGNGELINKGANIVTRLGFRIIKEYSGDLMGANSYTREWDGYLVAVPLEEHPIYDVNGIFITGWYYTGTFYRDAFFPKSQTEGDFDLGIYLNILGGGFNGEGFGYYLKPNDTLKIQAIAKNDLGVGYGDDIFEITTGQNLLYEPVPPIVSPTSVEKSVTIRNVPEGEIATRVGIRLGRTSGCNEIDVFEDGEWGNDDKIIFFIPDLVPGEKYYEEPYMVLKDIDSETGEEWEEEIIDEEEDFFVIPDWDEDWDYDTTIPTYEEYNYKIVIREIRCEKMSDQSFIDKAGRRRSITLNNHLIQTEEVNKEVINDYLNKFQIIKLKVSIDYDIPIPFERGDVILIGDGKHKFKEDGEGEILSLFKADGMGEILFRIAILAKIRKIDGNYVSGNELLLSLELEV